MPRGYRYVVLAVVGFLSLANAEQHQRTNQQRQEQRRAPVAPPGDKPNPDAGDKPGKGCEGTTKPKLSCDAISAQAGIDQARDADKQAYLAGWQTAVGGLTLIAAVFAAIFAWLAAFHTKRSADIADRTAATELRPWITIDAKPSKVLIEENALTVTYDLVFENKGETVARNFWFWNDTLTGERDHFDTARAKQTTWQPNPHAENSWSIIPGEIVTRERGGIRATKLVHWRDTGDGDRTAIITVAVTAFYRGPFSDDWFRTDRIFRIGENRSVFKFPVVRASNPRPARKDLIADYAGGGSAT